MIYSYYPGCTLKTKAKDLDVYGRKSAEKLGITLEELPEWQCCGGVYPLASDEVATKLSSVRALLSAREKEQTLLTMCSACHHVIKRVNYDMQNKPDFASKVNKYLKLDEEYSGETRVIHYLEMLRDDYGFDKLKQQVVKPLKGRKIAAYYGCLLLRPGKEMAFDNPENPTIIEDFIRAIGAEPVEYPFRNECCGGYMTMTDKPLAGSMATMVVNSANLKGADCIITACPLCLYNLKQNGSGRIPVYYFTELLAEALGLK